MITMERITSENIELFKAVRLNALSESPSAFGSTYAREAAFTQTEWLARLERWNGEQGIGFLAMDKGRGCGIAGALLDVEDPTRAQLVSMWTAPTHRRHGVGQLLVGAVIDWAKSQKIKTLTLMVVSTFATRSLEEVARAATGPLWFQLYVYSDRSVSEALVRRAVRLFQERGVTLGYVWTRPENDAATRLYRSVGFEPTRQLVLTWYPSS